MATEGEVVCVTGGSGCIGSWLVRLLLDTVQISVKDESETKHLEALEGAETRLRLFQIDLVDYGSIVSALNGCVVVFHLASPSTIENNFWTPAIKGTINVLTAAKEAGVSRVVVTSSMLAMTTSANWRDDVVEAEDYWTDIEDCKKKGFWYPISKTLAEKAAWDFPKEKGLDVVVVNPGLVLGPVIPPRINGSMLLFGSLLQGRTEAPEDLFMGFVHFKDVALAHILVYENKSATGRLPKDTQPRLSKATLGSKRLRDLGLQFIPVEQIIKDAVESLKSRGFIS
ncbi:cinnamoyl-CoA reductase 1-like [Corylus avellana]|uniref:cinnamoyl-CoA reductase 1-like n=1 Tax=Corylus avellana TaxID=13451 RepID=UPI00286D4F1F|nr:cinnamoyl-CoA reductase 1-like [Corylus avellana]